MGIIKLVRTRGQFPSSPPFYGDDIGSTCWRIDCRSYRERTRQTQKVNANANTRKSLPVLKRTVGAVAKAAVGPKSQGFALAA